MEAKGYRVTMQLTSTQRKAIDHYYQELDAYHTHKVTHETAVRSAFQYLLATFAQSANWTLIPEQTLANGKRPDGTLRDTSPTRLPSSSLWLLNKRGAPTSSVLLSVF